mmetsp:Transcript_30968/g.92119  ORF Transcript_30968/g.92119 Transcript_30968/m.92119 type:complete len:994 (+) Transcript_30968:96-3077(+)
MVGTPCDVWAYKLGIPGRPTVSVHTGPTDLSSGPARTALQGMFSVCTPLVDEDGTMYISEGPHPKSNGVHRISGASGGGEDAFIWLHPLAGSPCLLDGSLYAALENGHAVCVKKTLEPKWGVKFCGACPQDQFSLCAERGMLVLPGIAAEPQSLDMLPPADHVYALDCATGATRWTFKTAMMLLNFTASIVRDLVVFTDLAGGVYVLNISDGSPLWQVKGEGSMLSKTTGGASVFDGTIYQSFNLKAKKDWNKPAGGQGIVRAYDLRSGKKKWDYSGGLEAHAVPTVMHLGRGGKPIVVVGIGANTGGPPPSPPAGDQWKGLVVALDAQTGTVEWQFEPPVHKGAVCAGCNGTFPIKLSSWSSAICGADGTVYIGWHGGSVFALNSANGAELSSFDLGAAIQGTPALGADGVLAVATFHICAVFRMGAAAIEKQVLQQPLRPFEESGTSHFCPCRVGPAPERPYLFPWQAPGELSKPAWCYRRKDRRSSDWYIGSALLDAQRNVYFGSMEGHLTWLRADGTPSLLLRIPCGTAVVNGALVGRSFFFNDTLGFVHSFDIETAEVNWRVRCFPAHGASGCALSATKDVVLTAGEERGTNGENMLCALEPESGAVRWTFRFPVPGYNTFPQLTEDLNYVVVGAINGGWYAVSMTDGELAKSWLPPWTDSFSTAGPTVGPRGRVYVTSNLQQQKDQPWPTGITRCFDIPSAELKWEVEDKMEITQVPTVVPAELAGGTELVLVPIGHQACGTEIDHSVRNVFGGSIPGRLAALETETGKERWSFSPPPLPSAYPAGASDGDIIPPDAWSNAVVDSRGTVYITWMGGIIYALRAETGAVLSRYEMGSVSNGSPALAPGMLVIVCFDRVICWRDPEMEEAWRSQHPEDPRAGAALHTLPVKGPEVEEEVGATGLPRHGRRLDEPEGQTWVVVGGSKGGIVVRQDHSTSSAELGRLATGARILELERKGERLHYKTLSGDGPATGWVSISLKGAPLVKPQ